jgi:DNA-directed RNA polymerase specialized sigma24 family protein
VSEAQRSESIRGVNEPMSERESRLNELHAEHFEAVRRYVWRRDPALADDVVAETFLVAWRRIDEVPSDARPWLIGVARNVRLNVRRSAQRQRALADRVAHSESDIAVPDPWKPGGAVRAALASLSDRDREILLLAVWDELDHAQIAVAVGCSRANVSLRLHRARRRFAAALAAAAHATDSPPFVPLTHGGTSDVS